MKFAPVICVAGLFALVPGIAGASGLNLAWDTCVGDGGTMFRAFACNSNLDTGPAANVLIASFLPGADIPNFTAAEALINVLTMQPLPAWWGNGCAGKSVIGGSVVSPCQNDAYNGGANTVAGLYTAGVTWDGGQQPNPYGGLMTGIGALPPGSTQALAAGIEYFVIGLTVHNSHTTGAGACDGCLVPACLHFQELWIGQPPGVPPLVETMGDVQPIVYWQSNVYTACYGATPARNTTWGAIKSIYR